MFSRKRHIIAIIGEIDHDEYIHVDLTDPASINNAVLCSGESSWINGANISIDGGMNAHVMKQIHGF